MYFIFCLLKGFSTVDPDVKSLMRRLNITKSRLLKFPNKRESSVMKDVGFRKLYSNTLTMVFSKLKDI